MSGFKFAALTISSLAYSVFVCPYSTLPEQLLLLLAPRESPVAPNTSLDGAFQLLDEIGCAILR